MAGLSATGLSAWAEEAGWAGVLGSGAEESGSENYPEENHQP